jgi:hypothetical protein
MPSCGSSAPTRPKLRPRRGGWTRQDKGYAWVACRGRGVGRQGSNDRRGAQPWFSDRGSVRWAPLAWCLRRSGDRRRSVAPGLGQVAGLCKAASRTVRHRRRGRCASHYLPADANNLLESSVSASLSLSLSQWWLVPVPRARGPARKCRWKLYAHGVAVRARGCGRELAQPVAK